MARIGTSQLALEVPLTRAQPGQPIGVAIRAGDILLALERPDGISARNIFPATVISVVRRDVMMVVEVEAGPGPGVRLEAHLTLAAQNSLSIRQGNPVWVVVKTYSCHPVKVR